MAILARTPPPCSNRMPIGLTHAACISRQAANLDRYVAEAHTGGMQVALHCLGSGAIEQLLDAYERALAARLPQPDAPPPHRAFPTARTGPGRTGAAAGRGVGDAALLQPLLAAHGRLSPGGRGPPRAQQLDPIRSALAAGLEVAFGSDSPVTPMRPLQWLHAAVNHSNPDQRISVAEALRCCTLAGARLAFQEGDRGSLRPGRPGRSGSVRLSPAHPPPRQRCKTSRCSPRWWAGV